MYHRARDRSCLLRARERPEDGIDNEFQHSQRGAESGKWVSGALESAHP